MGNHDLLEYYQRELDYLRKSGAEFARRYPKIARRLELGENESTDPGIERLLESFAFQTARIQQSIESELPEISTALLSVCFPFFARPVPSMAVARFELARGDKAMIVPRHTPLFTQTRTGDPCRFRTSYELQLWPLELTHVSMRPADTLLDLESRSATSVLQFKFMSTGKQKFGDMGLSRLRLYLTGDIKKAIVLFDLLSTQVHRALVRQIDGSGGMSVRDVSVHPVGFGEDEDVLPDSSNVNSGYRLLLEFFSFSEKFRFFDITLPLNDDDFDPDRPLEILLLLGKTPEKFQVDRDSFLLGCTPIVNLFQKAAEPLRLVPYQSEYRLIPDLRREKSTEIHSINRVRMASSTDPDLSRVRPYFSFHHTPQEEDEAELFWRARRQETWRDEERSTDVYLTFTDLEQRDLRLNERMIFVDALMTNGNLAAKLPENSELWFDAMPQPVQSIRLLTKPTRTVQPPLGGRTLWRLISLLSIDLLNFNNERDALNALRETLRLCSFSSADPASAEKQVMGITGMKIRTTHHRIGSEGWRGFLRGVEVTLYLDINAFTGSFAFLLAAVLESFMGMFVSVNSFSRLVLKHQGREDVWKEWSPRGGVRTLQF